MALPPPLCCTQVMGAPLVGSPVQASVLTGGNIRFKGLRPRLQSKRLQMICEWEQSAGGLPGQLGWRAWPARWPTV